MALLLLVVVAVVVVVVTIHQGNCTFRVIKTVIAVVVGETKERASSQQRADFVSHCRPRTDDRGGRRSRAIHHHSVRDSFTNQKNDRNFRRQK